MAGNSIGKDFTVTTFGESHGKIVGVVVDGCPAGLPLSEADVQMELDRRIPADPKIVSGRVEKDVAKILSGVFNGFTTGAPIAMTVENREADSSRLRSHQESAKTRPCRLPSKVKYGGFQDYRGGGRFSGRVTVALIMAGAIAKKLLSRFDVDVLAYTRAIGKIKSDKKFSPQEIRKNKLRCSHPLSRLGLRRTMEEAIVDSEARRRKHWGNS